MSASALSAVEEAVSSGGGHIEGGQHQRDVCREDLTPAGMPTGKLAFLLHNILSPEECAGVVRAAEAVGFKRATVRTGFKTTEYQLDHRNGDNCYLVDAGIREMLLRRVADHLPQEFRLGRLVGLNERMTVLRYGPGGFFGEHTDGTYITPDDSAISFITIQLYLNDAFEGGETTFFPDGPARGDPLGSDERRRRVAVTPRTGSAVVFEHKILHKGSLVRSGSKYTLRADVLYTRYYPSPAGDDTSASKCAAVDDSTAAPPAPAAEQLPWERPSSSWLWSKCSVQ